MTEQKDPPADDTPSKDQPNPDKGLGGAEPSASQKEPSARNKEPSASQKEPSAAGAKKSSPGSKKQRSSSKQAADPKQGTAVSNDETSPQDQQPAVEGEHKTESPSTDDAPAEADTSPASESNSPSAAEEAAAAAAPAAKPKGRGLAILALLLALAGAGGVGYLYYLLVYLQPLEQVRVENAAMTNRYSELEQSLQSQIAAVETATGDSLARYTQQQAEQLADTEAAVTRSLNDALQAAPPSQREWKLAEAEYLLRIANHRVLMEQDSVGAMALLQAADQIMAELDDFALHQVRARLADEIIALRQVPRDDLQGIYLRLESIKSQIDNLPLPQPNFLSDNAADQAEQSVWQTLYEEMKMFIRVRSLDDGEALQPLLAPDEVRYLELNLRLALEQAQLATLKRQQEVFEQSLLNVRRWLVAHSDATDARTQALLESIDELMVLELARPMPEISGSLNELLSIRRGAS